MFISSVYNEVKIKYFYNQPGIYGFNENHPAFKANRSSEVATVSVNPNTRSTGAAAISINPGRHTSKANASGGEEDMIGRYLPSREIQ